MSAERIAFEAAVRARDWKTAYGQFRVLNMSEMLVSLSGLAQADREGFWAQRLTSVKFETDLPRLEYAYTVVTYHVLPATAPGDLAATGQVADAQKFLKDVIKKAATTLEKNLSFSMQAVNYVLTTLHVQGANWDYYQKGAGTYEYYLHKAAAEKDPKERNRLLAEADKHKDKLDVCLYDT